MPNHKDIDFSIAKGAIFSKDRDYRYALWRVWNANIKPMMFIGLNPSKASELFDDPTVTRCIARAAAGGFGGLLVANLYAYVSSQPDVLLGNGALLGSHKFIGEDTDYYMMKMVRMSGKVLCGWGSFEPVTLRAGIVLKMIPEPYCLGTNADGQPKHPLYIGYNIPIVKYER